MLAQNFKTAAELGIEENVRAALTGVLGMLERNEIVSAPHPMYSRPKVQRGFNMGHVGVQAECGTVACIGGWAAILMGKDDLSHLMATSSKELEALFYPHFDRRSGIPYGIRGHQIACAITTDQAASALRNYLTTGEARWSEVLAS